jgi:hypothetical protein
VPNVDARPHRPALLRARQDAGRGVLDVDRRGPALQRDLPEGPGDVHPGLGLEGGARPPRARPDREHRRHGRADRRVADLAVAVAVVGAAAGASSALVAFRGVVVVRGDGPGRRRRAPRVVVGVVVAGALFVVAGDGGGCGAVGSAGINEEKKEISAA